MNSKSPSTLGFSRPPKRLIFDRRYGWVFDEWKDPSEEALAGGRGMFCILPLAKALVEKATKSINFAAASVVKALENPGQFSPQALKTNLDDQVHKLMCSIQRPNFNLLNLKGNSSSIPSTSFFQHELPVNSNSQNS
ncbi:uncharacterized protein LOC143858204 [Tasmannia lanceolata]|uniref:uncharacterized protein LOC143858204 n=1 Tax=Tasmannia lanceolata TaxID=3420 RepID=UPI0040634997